DHPAIDRRESGSGEQISGWLAAADRGLSSGKGNLRRGKPLSLRASVSFPKTAQEPCSMQDVGVNGLAPIRLPVSIQDLRYWGLCPFHLDIRLRSKLNHLREPRRWRL